MSDEIVIERDGVRITISEPQRDTKGWLGSYRVSLITDGLSATTRVENPPYGTAPTVFFNDLAQNWKGWKGEKKWRAMEGELTFIAVMDSVGHITITASIHPDLCPPVWVAKVSVTVDAGQLEKMHRTFSRFFQI